MEFSRERDVFEVASRSAKSRERSNSREATEAGSRVQRGESVPSRRDNELFTFDKIYLWS